MKLRNVKNKIEVGVISLLTAMMFALTVNVGAYAESNKTSGDNGAIDPSDLTDEEREAYEETKRRSQYLMPVEAMPVIDENHFIKGADAGPLGGVIIPTKYDSRDAGFVSSVKDQDCLGLCWAFSTYEAVQDSIMAHGLGTAPDFSEYALGYYFYNQPIDRLGLTEGDIINKNKVIGSYDYYQDGNITYAGMMFAKGGVFKDESQARYTDLIDTIKSGNLATLPDSECYKNNSYSLTNFEIYNMKDESAREAIKYKIMTNGAGAFGYSQNADAMDYTYYAYYYSEEVKTPSAGGHGVAVVGWDDDYPSENFRFAPPGNGAWLVKNSWGENWGLDGYFWMSYYDPTIQQVTFFDVEKSGSYDNIYQYDGMVVDETLSGYKSGANVYTAKQNETINAVSFYTDDDGVDADIYIYKNPEADNPSDGELVYTCKGLNFGHMGYHKYDLPEDDWIKLKKGDRFSVIVEMTLQGEPASQVREQTFNWYGIDIISNANKGESFLSIEDAEGGISWEDAGIKYGGNLRIKAFTFVDESEHSGEISLDKTSYEISSGEFVDADVQIDGVSIMDSAKLSFEVEDEKVAFANDMGRIYGRTPGETSVTVTYGDRQVTAKVIVNENPDQKTIIERDEDYATVDNPVKVALGSGFYPVYSVTPKAYTFMTECDIEALDDGVDIEKACTSIYGRYVFNKAGNYKITVSIPDDSKNDMISEEFYVDAYVDIDNVEKDDYASIQQIPYDNWNVKLFRYDYGKKGVNLNIDFDIEEDYDWLYIFGSDKADITEQEAFDFGFSEFSASEGSYNYDICDEDYDTNDMELISFITGKAEDVDITVPYRYVYFVMCSDMYSNGSYLVNSVDDVPDIQSISLDPDEKDINVIRGDSKEYKLNVTPSDISYNYICCLSEDENIASVNYDPGTGEMEIIGKKAGETSVSVYSIMEDEPLITIDVNVVNDPPKEFKFDYEDSKLSVVRNHEESIRFNDDKWMSYDISYEPVDPTVAYIDKEGWLVSVTTGTTDIKATVDLGLGEENPSATLSVTVTAPEDQSDVSNLQTPHNYIPGMEETYTYKAPEGTECMNLFFDGRSKFDKGDYITICDKNGYYYSVDTDETPTISDSEIVVKYAELLVARPITVYGDEVTIHFVSNGEIKYDDEQVDTYVGESYGFRVKRIQTGKAAREIEVLTKDIKLDFSTYSSKYSVIKTKITPEDAIDRLVYKTDNPKIVSIDSSGSVTAKNDGETTFAVFTNNPAAAVRDTGNVFVAENPIEDVVFYDMDGNELEDDILELEAAPGAEYKLFVKTIPWNTSKGLTWKYDKDRLLIYKSSVDTGYIITINNNNEMGDYEIQCWVGSTTEDHSDGYLVKTINLKITDGSEEPDDPDEPDDPVDPVNPDDKKDDPKKEDKKDDSDKKTASQYSNEWVDGKWYDADGKQTYKGIMSWKQNEKGWWLEDSEGWYPQSQWQKIDGKWYFFDTEGYMACEEWVDGYWLSSSGAWEYEGIASWHMNSKGWWFEDNLNWYAYSEWQKINGKWYYFGDDGYLLTSCYVGEWWVDETGACQ